MYLRRGEIVVANLGNGARGSEIGDKSEDGGPVRPVMVVSSYFTNQCRLRATVVPIMNYKKEGRELRTNWGFWISKKCVQSATLEYEESFVDCGQLWTLFAVPPKHPMAGVVKSDIYFDKKCGKIKDRLRLDLGLQIICNENITVPDAIWRMRFHGVPMQGDIVRMEVPSSEPRGNSQECHALVISSSAVDGIRNTIPLGHITVVPLQSAELFRKEYSSSIALIETIGLEISTWLAACQEVYTLDWKRRNTKILGHIKNMHSLEQALLALRRYLDLPAKGMAHDIAA